MGTLLKVIAFSTPLFLIVLFLYLATYHKFQAHFAAESVRFEHQFRQAWNSWKWESDNWTDEFLDLQEEEAKRLWARNGQAEKKIEELRRELDEVLTEIDRESNSTGNLTFTLPSPDFDDKEGL